MTGLTAARVPHFGAAAGLTEYSDALQDLMASVFPPEDVRETLGEVIAAHHTETARIAETEKYAHVTFFLNGGREDQFPGEDRILVPSPKVATYDHKPEMSAYQVTEKLEEAIASGKYDLIVCNYANPDMVGHTGMMEAAVKAVDTIDECLGRLRAAVEKAGGLMLLTADHGNIEMMQDPETDEPHTAHTTLDVPVIVLGAPLGHAAGKWPAGRCRPHHAGPDEPAKARADDRPFSSGARLVTRSGALLLSLLLAAHRRAAAQKYKRVDISIRPTPRPIPAGTPEPAIDLSHALPGKALASLPSSSQQLKSLSSELNQGKPQLASAKEKSETLAAEAADLRKKLIATAARIESLERQKIEADAQIAAPDAGEYASQRRLCQRPGGDHQAARHLGKAAARHAACAGHASRRCAGRGAGLDADRRVAAAGVCPRGKPVPAHRGFKAHPPGIGTATGPGRRYRRAFDRGA